MQRTNTQSNFVAGISTQLRGIVQRTNKNLNTGQLIRNQDSSLNLVGSATKFGPSYTTSSFNKRPNLQNNMGGAAAAAVFLPSPSKMSNDYRAYQQENLSQFPREDLQIYSAISDVAADLQRRSRSNNFGGQDMRSHLQSIESNATVNQFKNRINRNQTAMNSTIDNEFQTIYEQECETELNTRQRIFEDVIIQRIKVIQDYVKRQAKKSQQTQPIKQHINLDPSQIDFDIEEKVDSVLKYKLEAATEKLNDRIAQLEQKMQQLKKTVQTANQDFSQEQKQIRECIFTSTTDILHQVQNQILPQAQHSQEQQLNHFKDELVNLINQNSNDQDLQQLGVALNGLCERTEKLEGSDLNLQRKLVHMQESQASSQQIMLEFGKFQNIIEESLIGQKQELFQSLEELQQLSNTKAQNLQKMIKAVEEEVRSSKIAAKNQQSVFSEDKFTKQINENQAKLIQEQTELEKNLKAQLKELRDMLKGFETQMKDQSIKTNDRLVQLEKICSVKTVDNSKQFQDKLNSLLEQLKRLEQEQKMKDYSNELGILTEKVQKLESMERLGQQELQSLLANKTSQEKPQEKKSQDNQVVQATKIEPLQPDLNLMLGELNKSKQQPAPKNKQNAYWGAAPSQDGFDDDFDKIDDIPISEDPQSQRKLEQNDSIDSFKQDEINIEDDPVIIIDQRKAKKTDELRQGIQQLNRDSQSEEKPFQDKDSDSYYQSQDSQVRLPEEKVPKTVSGKRDFVEQFTEKILLQELDELLLEHKQQQKHKPKNSFFNSVQPKKQDERRYEVVDDLDIADDWDYDF